jgi:hypothetical protein
MFLLLLSTHTPLGNHSIQTCMALPIGVKRPSNMMADVETSAAKADNVMADHGAM